MIQWHIKNQSEPVAWRNVTIKQKLAKYGNLIGLSLYVRYVVRVRMCNGELCSAFSKEMTIDAEKSKGKVPSFLPSFLRSFLPCVTPFSFSSTCILPPFVSHITPYYPITQFIVNFFYFYASVVTKQPNLSDKTSSNRNLALPLGLTAALTIFLVVFVSVCLKKSR